MNPPQFDQNGTICQAISNRVQKSGQLEKETLIHHNLHAHTSYNELTLHRAALTMMSVLGIRRKKTAVFMM